MEQNYDSRKARDNESASGKDRASERQGGGGFASNSALTAAMGGETPPDPGLGNRMAARMSAAFGPSFGVGAMAEGPAAADAGVVQMKRIGEPDHGAPVTGSLASLRGILEQRSSVSLDDVNVHYNSSKPAEIGALAYAKGTDVFMGPGQEKYLGHELTHVVQQKQGLVRSTGTVGGMPVNTSPALESAADHMQVSAAPETASAPVSGGVVQGVFKSVDGKELSKKDIMTMIEMMEDSLSAHQTFVEGKGAMNTERESVIKKTAANQGKLSKEFEARRKTLRKRFLEMADSKEEFDAGAELSKEVNAAQVGAEAKGFENLGDVTTGVVDMNLKTGSDYSLAFNRKMYNKPELAQEAKNTTQGYDDTLSKFSLAKDSSEIMAGVSDIADYDPAKADFSTLQSGRMANSTTFSTAQDASSGKNASSEAKSAMKKKLKQFDNATKTATKGAVKLRETETVGFSDLYTLMCGINKSLRAGDKKEKHQAGGGKIRGMAVSAGAIDAVGSAKLPEDVLRTFSFLASKINEIKQTKDRDLQKTQAIQLAAFAYQMTISEHMFEDGNGRSCRLLSDAILQTFGLPPHLPTDAEKEIGGTIGNDLDFAKGADVFLQGVQASDKTMKEKGLVPPAAKNPPAKQAAAKQAAAKNPPAKQQPAAPPPAAQQVEGQKTSDETLAYRTTAVPEEFDPEATSTDEKLALLYKKIKNPDPGDTEETISARKEMFSDLRARQMRDQAAAQAPTPAPAPEKAKKKKRSWKFWKR